MRLQPGSTRTDGLHAEPEHAVWQNIQQMIGIYEVKTKFAPVLRQQRSQIGKSSRDLRVVSVGARGCVTHCPCGTCIFGVSESRRVKTFECFRVCSNVVIALHERL